MRMFLNKFKNDQTFFLSCVITAAVITQKIASGETISETDFAPLLVGAASPAVRARKRAKGYRSVKFVEKAHEPKPFFDSDAEI